MSDKLFLFRPEPGWTATADLAREQGFILAGQPLFAVEAMEWDAPDAQDFDGLLVGSANVFRHGGLGLAQFSGLPVLAVGQATAEAAEAAGFSVEAQGGGGLQVLLETLAGTSRKLLRLGGAVRIPLDLPDGITVEERAVYRSVPVPLNADTAAKLVVGGVVALHSGEAARHLDEECQRLGVDRGGLILAALAPRVAQLAGEGWKSIHIASAASDTQLLALARSLCKTEGSHGGSG